MAIEWTETTPSLAKASTRGLDHEILAVAGAQGGAVDLSQLQALGLKPSAVRARVRAGRLHRRYHGVYAVGRPDLRRDGEWWAAVLACGPGALLSHSSATVAAGLLRSDSVVIHVTVPSGRRPRHEGIRVHRADLSEDDMVLGDGVPRTSPARTLLDLAATAPVGVVESAVRRADGKDLEILHDHLARWAGQRGVRVLRGALAAAGFGEGQPRSELERRFLALCRRYHLPEPLVNHWVPIAGEEMQVDFAWWDARVIVETDGFATHGSRQAFVNDRRRDQKLIAHGWQVVRLSWSDVEHEQPRTAALLGQILASRNHRPPR